MTWTAAIVCFLSAMAGAATGTCYFLILRRAVRLHAGSAAAVRVVPLHLLRPALAFGAFWGIAQLGAWPLLSALAGFLAARAIIQWRMGAP